MMSMYDRTGAGGMMPAAAPDPRARIAQTMMNVARPQPRVGGMPMGNPAAMRAMYARGMLPPPSPVDTGTAAAAPPPIPPVNTAAMFDEPPVPGAQNPLFAAPPPFATSPAAPAQPPPQLAKPIPSY